MSWPGARNTAHRATFPSESRLQDELQIRERPVRDLGEVAAVRPVPATNLEELLRVWAVDDPPPHEREPGDLHLVDVKIVALDSCVSDRGYFQTAHRSHGPSMAVLSFLHYNRGELDVMWPYCANPKELNAALGLAQNTSKTGYISTFLTPCQV